MVQILLLHQRSTTRPVQGSVALPAAEGFPPGHCRRGPPLASRPAQGLPSLSPVRWPLCPSVAVVEDDPRTGEIERLWKAVRTLSGTERAQALEQMPGALRPFFVRAVQLHDANTRLQEVMAPVIVRHRRRTEHRRYWIGREYPPDAD